MLLITKFNHQLHGAAHMLGEIEKTVRQYSTGFVDVIFLTILYKNILNQVLIYLKIIELSLSHMREVTGFIQHEQVKCDMNSCSHISVLALYSCDIAQNLAAENETLIPILMILQYSPKLLLFLFKVAVFLLCIAD